jgi:hypothetical protein
MEELRTIILRIESIFMTQDLHNTQRYLRVVLHRKLDSTLHIWSLGIRCMFRARTHLTSVCKLVAFVSRMQAMQYSN